MALPLKLDWGLAQTKWKSQIDPVLANPITQGNVIAGVKLISGVTVVNHLLGHAPLGWFVCDIDGPAQIYRSAPSNALTLTLTSNAAVTINLAVF